MASDAREKCEILEDPAANQAPKHLDPFNWPNGVSIHLFHGWSNGKAQDPNWMVQIGWNWYLKVIIIL